MGERRASIYQASGGAVGNTMANWRNESAVRPDHKALRQSQFVNSKDYNPALGMYHTDKQATTETQTAKPKVQESSGGFTR